MNGEDVYQRYYERMSDDGASLRFTASDIALFYYDGLEPGSYMTYMVLPLTGASWKGESHSNQ